MRRPGLAIALAGVVAFGVSGAARSGAPGHEYMAADISVVGYVNLFFVGAPENSLVIFREHVGESVTQIGSVRSHGPGVQIRRAVTWRCDRLIRRFSAYAIAPDTSVITGGFTVKTPSCAERLDVKMTRPDARTLRITQRDTWGLGGVPTKICISPRVGAWRCTTVALAVGQPFRARRFVLDKAKGPWQVEITIGSLLVRSATIAVHGSKIDERPVILTTGDSTIQGIDSFLKEKLSPVANVLTRSHIGSAISHNLAGFDWRTQARSQTALYKPVATIISLGANEGGNMLRPDGERVGCCGGAWISEYSRRVRQMMLTYSRGGAGAVLWLDLPASKEPTRARITAAVNEALYIAARGLKRTRVVRLTRIFSPDGRFHQRVVYNGRNISVREPDGVHLNVTGARIAADAVIAAMQSAGGASS